MFIYFSLSLQPPEYKDTDEVKYGSNAIGSIDIIFMQPLNDSCSCKEMIVLEKKLIWVQLTSICQTAHYKKYKVWFKTGVWEDVQLTCAPVFISKGWMCVHLFCHVLMCTSACGCVSISLRQWDLGQESNWFRESSNQFLDSWGRGD